MQIDMPHTKRTKGITIHTVKTEKFKTNLFVLKVKAPLEEKNVTRRALLPYVLQSATAHSPSTMALHRRLDNLYGATLHVSLSKKGESHIISFHLEVANEKYISGAEPLLEKSLHLLAEVLLQPKMKDGILSPDIVSKEKRTMKQRVQSIYDDKIRYSTVRLIEEMCANEPYRFLPFGKEDEIDALTSEALTTYYHDIFLANQMDLYIIGDIHEEQVISAVEQSFSGLHTTSGPLVEKSEQVQVTRTKMITETQDIEQGKLNLGYRTHTTYGDEDYDALQVFNGIFGGFPHSKLFMNVREKASLAYYASSKIEIHKGLLLVFSGIASSDYDQAVSIMKEQMENMVQGNFTDEELELTKIMLQNQLFELLDHAGEMIEFFYRGVITGRKRSVEDYLQGIRGVTREDILSLAQKIELDTIYFLKGKEDSK